MLCEKCGSEIESITCGHCGKIIVKLGSFCYFCGKEYVSPVSKEEGDTIDFTERVLCSDGACIGVIDEREICKVCGKPYTPES